MKAFVIYDDAGSIIRCGTCPDEDFASQVHNEGERILEATASFDPNVFRVENYTLVKKDQE